MGDSASTRPTTAAARAVLAASIALPFLVAACATSASGPSSTSYVVSSVSTPFFKYGPAQAFGADLTLSQGERLTMLTRSFGFSRVMLQNGQSGYVSTEDIKSVAPTPVPKPTPSASRSTFWGRKKSGPGTNFNSSPNPLFDTSDVPPPPLPTNSGNAAPVLHPEPSNPKPAPSTPGPGPTFRY